MKLDLQTVKRFTVFTVADLYKLNIIENLLLRKLDYKSQWIYIYIT